MSPQANDLTAQLNAYNVTMLNVMYEALKLNGLRPGGPSGPGGSSGPNGNIALNKRGLIDRLAHFLGTSKHLTTVRTRLTARQWQTLAYHRLRAEPVPLSSLLVRSTAGGATEREALSELSDLLTIGCLVFVEHPEYNYKISPTLDRLVAGEYLDLRVVSFPLFLDAAEKSTTGVDVFGWSAPEPRVVRSASYLDFQRECYLALRSASDGDLKLTSRGLPYKTALARLSAAVAGIAVGRGGRTKLSEIPVSPRLWLVLAVLRAAGLFGEEDDLEDQSQLTTTPGAADLLSQPVAEQARRLVEAWAGSIYNELARVSSLDFGRLLDAAAPWVDPSPTAYYGTDLPTLSRLSAARRSIVRAIQTGARERSGDWLRLSALQSAVRADDPEMLVPLPSQPSGGIYARRAHYYEGIHQPNRRFPDNLIRLDLGWLEVEGAYIATVLAEPLHWLGLVELGAQGDGKLVAFRLTSLGRHVFLGEPFEEEAVPATGPRLIVQPSFEVIVLDATANLGLVAKLDDFAERTSLDRAATYRLTREAVVRGFDRGHSVQSMVDLLESASSTLLPQNVRFSLEEWSRLYERVHVRRRTALLVADSPAQLDAWLADPELAGSFGKRLSSVAVLVVGDRRVDTIRQLAQRDPAHRTHDYALPARRRFRIPEPTLVEPLPEADEPYLRYRLARFAVPENGRFRITPESIRGAAARGLSPEAVISYLQTVVDGRVPEDTCLRVRGWGGFYGPLRHTQAVVVELPPGLTPADLRRIREVRRALLHQLGANVITIDPAGFEAARAALAERGLSLEPGLTPSSDVGPDEPERSGPSGSATLRLQVLPPPLLRRYVQDAISAGRWLVFGLVEDGRRQAVLLLPLRIFGRDGVAYVSCRVDDPVEESEIHDIPLQLIDAIGDAAELGLV